MRQKVCPSSACNPQGPETISIGNGDLTDPTNTFNVNKRVGVQGQVYTIINSDATEYQHDTLFYGAWMGQDHWSDVATYIGSTTGTSALKSFRLAVGARSAARRGRRVRRSRCPP